VLLVHFLGYTLPVTVSARNLLLVDYASEVVNSSVRQIADHESHLGQSTAVVNGHGDVLEAERSHIGACWPVARCS
jgi:hypothetical protein